MSIVETGRELYVGILNPFARYEGCGDTFGNAISSGALILNPELTHSKTPPQTPVGPLSRPAPRATFMG